MHQYHKHIQGEPKDAIHPPPHPILDNLALQERHAREVRPNRRLDRTHRPEQQALVLQQHRTRQARARNQRDRHEHKRRALARVRRRREREEGRPGHHGAHEAREDEAVRQLLVRARARARALERRRPEEDEQVHGAFEEAGRYPQREDLLVAHDCRERALDVAERGAVH